MRGVGKQGHLHGLVPSGLHRVHLVGESGDRVGRPVITTWGVSNLYVSGEQHFLQAQKGLLMEVREVRKAMMIGVKYGLVAA